MVSWKLVSHLYTCVYPFIRFLLNCPWAKLSLHWTVCDKLCLCRISSLNCPVTLPRIASTDKEPNQIRTITIQWKVWDDHRRIRAKACLRLHKPKQYQRQWPKKHITYCHCGYIDNNNVFGNSMWILFKETCKPKILWNRNFRLKAEAISCQDNPFLLIELFQQKQSLCSHMCWNLHL